MLVVAVAVLTAGVVLAVVRGEGQLAITTLSGDADMGIGALRSTVERRLPPTGLVFSS